MDDDRRGDTGTRHETRWWCLFVFVFVGHSWPRSHIEADRQPTEGDIFILHIWLARARDPLDSGTEGKEVQGFNFHHLWALRCVRVDDDTRTAAHIYVGDPHRMRALAKFRGWLFLKQVDQCEY